MIYQGILTLPNGTAAHGPYSLKFSLYATSTNGTALWTETQENVGVENGIFNVILGSVNPIALPFDKQYYLGITVGSRYELSPRIQLTSCAYSFHAACADSIRGGYGTITGVTAGTGLSGGGTKGNVTLGIANGGVGNTQIAIGAVTSGDIAGGQVVKSINTLKDSITLAAGTNVSITPSGNTLTIAASSGGSGTITGVTAGTGLSGGGNSGNVTLSAAVPFALSGNVGQTTAIISGINDSSNYGIGVLGVSPNGFGVEGLNTNGGYGVYGLSPNGFGVYGLSSDVGVFGNSSNGYGVYGYNSTNGNIGLLGGIAAPLGELAPDISSANAGVYGYSPTGIAVFAEGNFTATGTKAATVKLNNGSQIELYAEEAAEVYFTDYGESTLVNGKVHIQLDPAFLQTVTIDTQHPIKVFVQLEGDCNGVYVTNKTSTGFDVAELKSGTSNASFDYRVVCKRKYYEDERMATVQQAGLTTRRMMQTAWPEVISKEKADQEKMKAEQDKMKAMQIEKKH
jgi:hypothetical protein